MLADRVRYINRKTSKEFPVYLGGINRNLVNNVLRTNDDDITDSGMPVCIIDFSGIAIYTLEVNFDAKWRNSQPRLIRYTKVGVLEVERPNTNLSIASGVDKVNYDMENLYTTFGNLASGTKIGLSRIYNYSGKRDLVYAMSIRSHQYGGGYLKINHIKVNGKNIIFRGTTDTTIADWK